MTSYVDYLSAAARHLDVKRAAIVKHRVVEDEFVVLVDHGVGGVKKYRLPLDSLTEPEKPTPRLAATPAGGDEPDKVVSPPSGDPIAYTREKTAYPIAEVAAEADASHLGRKLRDAGFHWSYQIIDAAEDELTAINGIGEATAKRIKEAAAKLEAGNGED